MAQRGWITRQQRKKQGAVWVYHWYCTKPDTGKRAEQTCVIGSLADFATEADVWQEIGQRHLQPQNETEIPSGRLTFRDLAASYQRNSMQDLAESTQQTVQHVIEKYLIPRWGDRLALEIQPLEIEQWLRSLRLANPTKDKLRRVMSIIYSKAQKYGLLPRDESSNPVRWVEQTALSRYKPVRVDPATAGRILERLSGAELALALLVAATGLRISEALGLQWQDVDYEARQINLRRVWVGNRSFDRLKTQDSEAPVPLTHLLAECLRAWHAETVYGQPSDWVFASKRSKGQKPRSASILTADYLRPAAVAAGVQLGPGQRFGFHNFRHGLATWLVNQGTDVKTVQGLLRHANVTTTLGKYAHTVNASMMAAQEAVLEAMKSATGAVN
jgi:integrase